MPHILVIDDQSHVRAMVKLVLEARGFEVTAMGSAAEGLRAVGNSSFDVAIVDIFMPDMDGVKFIKVLRERIPGFRVVAMSGVHLSISERTALDYLPSAPGLSDVICLKKPFRPTDLLHAIGMTNSSAASPAQAAVR
jgi:CheY-like chemotaxis protein